MLLDLAAVMEPAIVVRRTCCDLYRILSRARLYR
jgi:hypothetical protein